MKDRIVTRIDFVSSIDITCDEKLITPHPNEVPLMGRGVCTEHGCSVDVVVVIFASRNVIRNNQQAIKVLFGSDNRTDVIKVSIDCISHTVSVCFVEMVDDALLDDVDWVLGNTVKVTSNSTNNGGSDTSHLIAVVCFPQYLALLLWVGVR